MGSGIESGESDGSRRVDWHQGLRLSGCTVGWMAFGEEVVIPGDVDSDSDGDSDAERRRVMFWASTEFGGCRSVCALLSCTEREAYASMVLLQRAERLGRDWGNLLIACARVVHFRDGSGRVGRGDERLRRRSGCSAAVGGRCRSHFLMRVALGVCKAIGTPGAPAGGPMGHRRCSTGLPIFSSPACDLPEGITSNRLWRHAASPQAA
jgi:hypothetical protein